MTEHAVVEPAGEVSAAAAITTGEGSSKGSSSNDDEAAAAGGSNAPVASLLITVTTPLAANPAEPTPEQECVTPPLAVGASEAGTEEGGGASCLSLSGDDAGGWKVGPEDFTLLCVIGQGAFGRVLQVRSKFDGEVYAMKVISKRMLKKKNHLSYMRAERDIMTKVDFPFIVGLKLSFQTEEKLFLVMDYLSGGELFFHLRKQGLILEDTARFYGAELVLALEHLHSKGIIHRDLKPENVLVDRHGHLCLTDFGLAKELNSTSGSGSGGGAGGEGGGGGDGDGDGEEEGGRTRTVCGTNEYMCPEMILRKGYGKAADWWSLGALMYEMMAGHAPFRAKAVKELNRKILHEKLSLPKWLTSDAHAVLRGLLERNVQKRLGAARSTMFELGGVAALKAHRFFAKIDWQALLRKQLPAPVVPALEHEADTSNFDEEFTKMDLSLSLVEVEGAEATHSDTFTGFSFIEPSIPLPAHEPAYKEQARRAREARRLQQHADPDLFDGDGVDKSLSARKKKKKNKKPAAATAEAAAVDAPVAVAVAVVQAGVAEEEEGGASGGSGVVVGVVGVTGAGASPGPASRHDDATASGPGDGSTGRARGASIAESGLEASVEPEDGVDKTLRLLQAAAAAGAAARKQQGQKQEEEEGGGVAALADFPPLAVATEAVGGETTALPPPRPSASFPSSPAANKFRGPPNPSTAAAAVSGQQQAPAPPSSTAAVAPTSAAATTKPAFSWSAVVVKHAAAPASPLKAQPPALSSKLAGAAGTGAVAAASAEWEEEEEEEDGFVVVTSTKRKPKSPGAKLGSSSSSSSSKLNVGAKAFVPRGSASRM